MQQCYGKHAKIKQKLAFHGKINKRTVIFEKTILMHIDKN